ncbi:MAG: hypothetical protein CME70_11945 [Halobacteriovorax sp.]|nr:hypothetical protein [Halobacteriovorax sp.]|tara:strand:- start:322387 stop:324270 length:1884 start_codon:yes stop_codon:yes gene_type:complete
MKIIFAKIQKNKCLSSMWISFTEDFQVKETQKTLSITYQKKTDMSLYSPISSILGIIGENGSGKSSIIENICSDLLLDSSEIYSDNVYIFWDEMKKEITLLNCNKGVKCLGFSAEIVRLPQLPVGGLSLNVFYYSPIYSPHQSESFLSKEFKTNGKNLGNNYLYRGTLGKSKQTDIKTQFKFLRENRNSDLSSGFPKYFELACEKLSLRNFDNILVDSILDVFENNRNNKFEKLFYKFTKEYGSLRLRFFRDLNRFDKDYRSREDFVREYSNKAISRHIDHEPQNVSDFLMLQVYKTFFQALKRASVLEKALLIAVLFSSDRRTFYMELNKLMIFSGRSENFISLEEQGFSFKKFERSVVKIQTKFNNVEKVLTILRKNSSFDYGMPRKFYPEEEEELFIFQNTIFEKYNLETLGFSMGWQGVSSGQIAKLTLFSRLYSAFSSNIKGTSFMIILDEPDIYLHPEWQRTFLKDLRDFLRKIESKSSKEMSFQLLLTSHSPLLIGDLKKDSVKVLKRSNRGSTLEDVCDLTFGSNIHTSYAITFSLDSTKGAIFDEAINSIYRLIEVGDEISLSTLESSIELLKETGDELIRESFLDRIKEIKIKDEKQNKIKNLKVEIAKLESGNDNN